MQKDAHWNCEKVNDSWLETIILHMKIIGTFLLFHKAFDHYSSYNKVLLDRDFNTDQSEYYFDTVMCQLDLMSLALILILMECLYKEDQCSVFI